MEQKKVSRNFSGKNRRNNIPKSHWPGHIKALDEAVFSFKLKLLIKTLTETDKLVN